jgi:hypothetical protein
MSLQISLIHVNETEGLLYNEALFIYRNSFPSNEKQPEDLIRQRVASGQSVLYVAQYNTNIIGMCLLWDFSGIPFMLLDYFAVKEGFRGKNVGSDMFRLLGEISGKQNKMLVMEVEHPSYGGNSSERIQRLKFYLNNGAKVLRDVPYLLPPLDGTIPTEMLLLLAPAKDGMEMTGVAIRELIVRLYAELYSRNEDDYLLQTFINSVPPKIYLSNTYE